MATSTEKLRLDATLSCSKTSARALSIPSWFSEIAAANANRVALLCGDLEVGYAQLEAQSNSIAQGLIARGVQPGSTVGLYMQRSPEAIAAILGILKAGAAYVPFDPSYPAQLLKFIYSDSAPALMLVQPALLEKSGIDAFWGGPGLDVIKDFPRETSSVILPTVSSEDRAYIMYTSGSTGRPKGVQIPHRAVLRLVIDNDFAHFGPEEVILQLAPLAFDASTFEIWGALLHGGQLAILSSTHPSLEEISQTIASQKISTCWLTAGVFHLMVDHQLDGLKPLRQLLAGGDVLSVAHVEKALRGLPECRLINGYGPTENTTFSCCYTIPHGVEQTGPIPIGKAINNSEALILDSSLQPTPDGDDGELFVGGPGLALGYINRPDLDAERFIAHPFGTTPGARLYKTGDRVRRRADGNIDFLGRVDRQVKINGKRVELDEIEACLRRSGLVGDAAVISYESASAQRRVAAFVTPQPAQALSVEALREYLRSELPDYMQPTALSVLDALPLSPTGKVDRAKLQVPSTDSGLKKSGSAPKNELEGVLLGIWQQVLGSEGIGVEDNFFDLGGTSLQMMKVHAAIQSNLNRKLNIIDLFTYPRIRMLAAWMTQPDTASAPSSPINAQERARRQGAALARARPAPRVPVR